MRRPQRADLGDERRPARASNGLFAAGAAAAAVALAVLWFASSLAPALAFPPAVVAEAIVRTVPGELATASIELLGAWSMRLLITGVLAGSLVLGGLALRGTAAPGGARPWRAAA